MIVRWGHCSIINYHFITENSKDSFIFHIETVFVKSQCVCACACSSSHDEFDGGDGSERHHESRDVRAVRSRVTQVCIAARLCHGVHCALVGRKSHFLCFIAVTHFKTSFGLNVQKASWKDERKKDYNHIFKITCHDSFLSESSMSLYLLYPHRWSSVRWMWEREKEYLMTPFKNMSGIQRKKYSFAKKNIEQELYLIWHKSTIEMICTIINSFYLFY